MKNKQKIIVYWCRRDFRLTDNPGLFNAVHELGKTEEGNKKYFLPVYILEDYMLSGGSVFQFGYPSRYFVSQAISAFSKNFKNFLIFKGKVINTFENLQKNLPEYEIEIYVNEDVHPDFYKQMRKLINKKFTVKIFKDQMTVSKDTVSGTGSKYSIFTPFKKAVWKEFMSAKVLGKVNLENINYLENQEFKKIKNKINTLEENDFESIWSEFPKDRNLQIIDYKTNKKHHLDIDKFLDFKTDFNIYNWYYVEAEAQKAMKTFVQKMISVYKENRDSLEKDQTSKLSPALAWGLISARQIKQEIQNHFDEDFLEVNWFDKDLPLERAGILSYLSELVWREFYKYLLYHNPNLLNEEFQEKFKYKINWVEEKEAIKRFTAWIQGQTGYKVVDAAMMQLAKTGWMHNRSRMIVASILSKNLGVDWRWGQEYFRAMLIDEDAASNNGGWQWGASVGADPKPIRIFNPYTQAENYDSQNIYQIKWLGQEKLDKQMPPLVEHKVGRKEALERYGMKADASARDY